MSVFGALSASFRVGSFLPAGLLAPGGVVPKVDMDFMTNTAFVDGTPVGLAGLLTFTRAAPATAYYEQADGSLITFAADVPRIGDRGILSEETRTNVVLWSRDFTNVAWVKLNCTAAKDQTGPDGTVNGASSLTATAGNATCTQAIVLASSARWQSAYIKRLSGTGVVEMSMDGATFTPVVPLSTWSALEIPTQTLANPTVVFRIVTSGDAIAIDFVQNENDNLQRSSPIPTTTVSVARSADVILETDTSWISASEMTIYCQGSGNAPNTGTPAALFQLDHTSGSALIFARQTNAEAMTHLGRDAAAATQWSVSSDAGLQSTKRQRSVVSVKANDIAISGNSGVIVQDSSATVPTVLSRVAIGSQRTAQWWNGYVERFSAWSTALSDLNVKRLSASNTPFTILVEGDSILRSPDSNTSPAGWLRLNLSPKFTTRTYAVSGATVQGANSLENRAPVVSGEISLFREMNPYGKRLLIVGIGHNDFAISGLSTETFLAQLYAYTDARRADGIKVAVMSVPPSTFSGLNAWRSIVNSDIENNVGIHLDYYVDLALTSIGADADGADTSKYVDGTHPTAATAIVMAQAIIDQAIEIEDAL